MLISEGTRQGQRWGSRVRKGHVRVLMGRKAGVYSPSSGFANGKDPSCQGRAQSKGTAGPGQGPRREPCCAALWEGILEEGLGLPSGPREVGPR